MLTVTFVLSADTLLHGQALRSGFAKAAGDTGLVVWAEKGGNSVVSALMTWNLLTALPGTRHSSVQPCCGVLSKTLLINPMSNDPGGLAGRGPLQKAQPHQPGER